MNKADIIRQISSKSDLSHSDVELVVDEFFKTVEKEIIKGNEVKISSFGVFYKKKRLARKGTNPSDGSIITIPENNTVGFRPSKLMKEKLN